MPIVHYRETETNESEVWQIEYNKTEVTYTNSVYVADIPQPVSQFGKNPIQYINLSTNQIFYKYVDRPLTPEEEIEQVRIEMARGNTELFETMLLWMGGV